MRRWNIKSVDGSPLIKKAQAKLEASQTELLVKAYTLSKEKGIETNCLSFKAAELLLDHGADVDTIAAALLAQDLWDGRASKAEIRKALGNTVVNVLDGFKPSCFASAEPGPYSREIIHTFLESAAKTPRKALLFIAFRFIELDNALQTNSAEFPAVGARDARFLCAYCQSTQFGRADGADWRICASKFSNRPSMNP